MPESIDRYKILRLLGEGNMGRVYLALDPKLKREVALKVPLINAFHRPEVRARFLREAEAAARFHHPNFCPIFDKGEADGVPFLTMAYIHGQTLSCSIERGQGCPPRKAAKDVRQMALALAELHREGIIHRDLKPGNIMVNHRGELVIMDFGMALIVGGDDARVTKSGNSIGTPAYMSPEQAEGNLKAIGPCSDVYSLGVILYELLTGRLPFEGPALLVVSRVVYAEAPPPSSHRPDLDSRLEAICMKAMAKKPDDRYALMGEFAGALQSWLNDAPTPKKEERVPDLITTKTAAIPLKLIPAGTFLMGSPAGEGEDDERPQHKVTISKPFYLGIHPVIQGQYASLMGKNPSYFAAAGPGKERVTGMDTSRFPVESVSWYESVQFVMR